VMLPAPVVDWIDPRSGIAGQTLDIVIIGSDFTGATAVHFGPGVTVNGFVVDSASLITANVTIDPAAQPGDYDVIVTTPSGDGTLTEAFTILEQSPNVSVSWWYWLLIALLAAVLGLLLFALVKRRGKTNRQRTARATRRRA
jgi:hypothetical protein